MRLSTPSSKDRAAALALLCQARPPSAPESLVPGLARSAAAIDTWLAYVEALIDVAHPPPSLVGPLRRYRAAARLRRRQVRAEILDALRHPMRRPDPMRASR